MKLLDYNNNLINANYNLDNVELTEDFIDDFFVSTNPKYEATIDIGLPYTVTDYGYVHPYTFVYNGDVNICVNNIYLGRWIKLSTTSSNLRDTCTAIKVKPGDVITSGGTFNAIGIKFYPLEEPV